jgi:hypothetical protein
MVAENYGMLRVDHGKRVPAIKGCQRCAFRRRCGRTLGGWLLGLRTAQKKSSRAMENALTYLNQTSIGIEKDAPT